MDYLPGLQWTVIDDRLSVCKDTSREVETPLTQGKILSLVSSVFGPTGLLAQFSFNISRLLKDISTKNGQHLDNALDSGKEAEFLRWKKQILSVAETSIDRRYFITTRKKASLMGLLTHMNAPCVQWLFFVLNQSGSDETLFTTAFRTISSSHGNEVQKTNSQQKRLEDK